MLITSTAFKEGEWIPEKYTARGEDISPALHLEGIPAGTKALMITLDDASHPYFRIITIGLSGIFLYAAISRNPFQKEKRWRHCPARFREWHMEDIVIKARNRRSKQYIITPLQFLH